MKENSQLRKKFSTQNKILSLKGNSQLETRFSNQKKIVN